MKLFHKRMLCFCQSLMNKVEIRCIICVFSNRQALNHKLQSFSVMTSCQYNRYCKFKYIIHHPLRSTVKIIIISDLLRCTISMSCRFDYHIFSKPSSFILHSSKSSLKTPNTIKRCNVKQHSYKKPFLCIHALTDMLVNNTNYTNLNNHFHGLIKFLLINRVASWKLKRKQPLAIVL